MKSADMWYGVYFNMNGRTSDCIIETIRQSQAEAYEAGQRDMREAAAGSSDKWLNYKARDERQRFKLIDMQAMMKGTAKGISDDIRSLPIKPMIESSNDA